MVRVVPVDGEAGCVMKSLILIVVFLGWCCFIGLMLAYVTGRGER